MLDGIIEDKIASAACVTTSVDLATATRSRNNLKKFNKYGLIAFTNTFQF